MQNTDLSKAGTDDAVILSLRKCGHFLHHSAGKDSGKTSAQLLAALNEEEKKTLVSLLSKCLKEWQE